MSGPERRNLLERLYATGLPPAFIGLVLTILLALTLAPFLGGLDIKVFVVPVLPQPLATIFQFVLPLVWVVLLVPLFPPTRRSVLIAVVVGVAVEIAAVVLGQFAVSTEPAPAEPLGDLTLKLRDLEPQSGSLQFFLDDFYQNVLGLREGLGWDPSDAAVEAALPEELDLHRQIIGELTVCAHLKEIQRAFNRQRRDARIRFYVDQDNFYLRLESEARPDGASPCP